MTTTKLTADVDSYFDRHFLRTCEKIQCEPAHLLGVMFSESGCRARAHNKNGNASGLIQFMPRTLVGLGWRDGHEAFRRLAASEQLPYVEAYFSPWHKVGRPWDSAARIYQAVFLPATLATRRAPSDVVAAKGGFLGWAYEANAGFDRDRDLTITIAELDASIRRSAHGPRWREMLARLGIADELDELLDAEPRDGLRLAMSGDGRLLESFLRTPSGLQVALVELGFDVGPSGVDGFVGADTRAAVVEFQRKAEIKADGIAGPITRGKLAAALLCTAPA